jgi:hypothetical protein
MITTAQEWIERLDLQPLDFEGGWFREVFRSAEETAAAHLPERYDAPRALYTTIYYLLTPDTFSALHRLRTDEVYTFVAGDPVAMLQLHEDGTGREVRLANTGAPGTEPAVCVPRGVWQGSRLEPGGRYALLTTTMAPGWDPRDFELGGRAALEARFPDHAESVRALTRS